MSRSLDPLGLAHGAESQRRHAVRRAGRVRVPADSRHATTFPEAAPDRNRNRGVAARAIDEHTAAACHKLP